MKRWIVVLVALAGWVALVVAQPRGGRFSPVLTAEEIAAFGSAQQADADLEARVSDMVNFRKIERVKKALEGQTDAGLAAIEAVAVTEKAKIKP